MNSPPTDNPSDAQSPIDEDIPSENTVILPRNPGWGLWVSWILATALGSLIGWAIYLILPRDGCLYYVSSLVPVLVLAFSQWWILRRYLPDIRLGP
jgi:hypothetical protein